VKVATKQELRDKVAIVWDSLPTLAHILIDKRGDCGKQCRLLFDALFKGGFGRW
jgi:hypothetical protein